MSNFKYIFLKKMHVTGNLHGNIQSCIASSISKLCLREKKKFRNISVRVLRIV